MGRTIGIWAVTMVVAAVSFTATARQLDVSATISSQELSPSSFKYSLTLTNHADSTASASSFWFGWFPGYDLLPDAPTAFTAPAGWTGTNAPDIFGVASAQFTTTLAPLAPGNTLSGFSFTTPDAPSAIIGATSRDFGYPIEDTYVYSVAPQSGSVDALIPTTVVPEPASLSILGIGALAILRRPRRTAGI